MPKNSGRSYPTCWQSPLALPKDFEGSKEAYLAAIPSKFFRPCWKLNNLSNRIDAVCRKSAFLQVEEITHIASRKSWRFLNIYHSQRINSAQEESELAVRLGAKSADQLRSIRRSEIKLLLILMSSLWLCLVHPLGNWVGKLHQPEKFLEGRRVTLLSPSDWNQVLPMGNLVAQASILATFEKLSTAEVFAGLYLQSCSCLGLFDRGTFGARNACDFNLYPIADYPRKFLYHQATHSCTGVGKMGSHRFNSKRI